MGSFGFYYQLSKLLPQTVVGVLIIFFGIVFAIRSFCEFLDQRKISLLGYTILCGLIVLMGIPVACDQSSETKKVSGTQTPQQTSGSNSGGIASFFASKPDPVASFKSFAPNFVSIAQKTLDHTNAWEENAASRIDKRCLVVSNKYEMDVRKTDSLMSPYIGVLKLNVQQADGEQKTLALSWHVPMEVTFSLQDGKWVLKTAIIEEYFRYDGELDLKNADVMQPEGFKPFKIIADRLRSSSKQAGGA